jgi:hypothetical protein
VKKGLFYGFCIGAICAYYCVVKFLMTGFGFEFGYGFAAGAVLICVLLFIYDRYVGRISGDPDNLRWWEAPSSEFIKHDRANAASADCTQAGVPERAATGYLPPVDD